VTALRYQQFRQALVHAAARDGNGNLRRCWGCHGYTDPVDPRDAYCTECREAGRTRGGRGAGHAERVEAMGGAL